MKRRHFLAMLAALPFAGALPVRAASATIRVFKSPDCGCCSEWVKHLQSAGFTVHVTNVGDPGATRRRYNMPERFGSCHTAIVDDYVLEGHVPAGDVKRMLAERPAAIGLAVPGMPAGAPGMEGNGASQPFDVVLVDRAGAGRVYAHYPAGS
jgi:hypothetical protein